MKPHPKSITNTIAKGKDALARAKMKLRKHSGFISVLSGLYKELLFDSIIIYTNFWHMRGVDYDYVLYILVYIPFI